MQNVLCLSRRIVLYIFAVTTVSLSTGLVYGWPALRRNLLLTADDSLPGLSEDALGLIFTVGSWSTQGGRFFFGVLRDRWLGTRFTTCISLSATIIGIIGIAVSPSNNATVLTISLFLVGLGSGSQICLQPVASLFGKHRQGLILATISGAFQVSGLMFLIITTVSDDRRYAFGGLGVCLVFLTFVAVCLLPRGQFSDVIEKKDNEPSKEDAKEKNTDKDIISGSNDTKSRNGDDIEESGIELTDALHSDLERNNDTHKDKGVDGHPNRNEGSAIDVSQKHTEKNPTESITSQILSKKHPTAKEQMLTLEYFGLLTWFSVLVIPLQYYIATIGFQLEQKGDADGFVTSLFTIIYASSATATPIIGYIVDGAGVGSVQGLGTAMCALSFFTLTSKDLSSQIFGFAMYGMGRVCVFSTYFGNVGKRFGYVNYGTLAGFGLITSAVISLLQYPLINLTNGGQADIVNYACGAVSLGMLPYCVWLGCREWREKAPRWSTGR